jgi:hypothetical protein
VKPDSDGVDSIGARRGNYFYLRDSNSTGWPNSMFAFGWSADGIVVGDRDGDVSDSIGLKRGTDYFLKKTAITGVGKMSASVSVPSMMRPSPESGKSAGNRKRPAPVLTKNE